MVKEVLSLSYDESQLDLCSIDMITKHESVVQWARVSIADEWLKGALADACQVLSAAYSLN